jgi:hypothetical protein
MLKKRQDENPNPDAIEKLISVYITPLEDIVKHFGNLFLASSLEKENMDNEVASISNLNTKVNIYIYIINGYLSY